jgi:YVTN family beta-propeller protein
MASTVSPDGNHLAALTTDGGIALTIVDLKSWKVQQLIGNSTAANLRINNNNVGQEGPTYSPDGSTLWMPQIDGYRRFTVNPDGTVANPTVVSIPADGTKHALPAQAVFSADGSTVYAAVNGQNRVVAITAATGAIQQSWAVGNAPRDMIRIGNKIYVSNEGGRPAKAGESTLNSYSTQVPADPKTGAATTGTVGVIDLANPTAAVKSIDVGLHPTALYAKNGALFVTDTGSDEVSVIDTSSDAVVQTIATQPWPEAKVGYEPDGVTLTDDGHLLVTLGRANAVAVYRYTAPKQPVSYVGLLPTDYFPTAVTTVGDNVLISNTRGIDARRPDSAGHLTNDTTGSLQRFTLPDDGVTHVDTAKVFQQNGWNGSSVSMTAGKSNAQPVPVPLRLGDPSTIKHVFWVIKENRSYDQQFGDIASGNGDPALTQFGEGVTPNQHAMARQFGLYDNTYDPAANSAEGHNWMLQADNPEYTESSAGEYQRSYTTSDDALGHQRSGFLWTSAQAAGKTVRDFNEFQQYLTKPSGSTWQAFYCDAKNMEQTGQDTTLPTYSSAVIPSLNDVTDHAVPAWDMTIPDIYRYEMWKKDFQKNGPANLNIMSLITDHTGSTPLNPAAQVADNDLALGKIVDTVSHSKWWKDSAIFVVEDDTASGLDHVDGHRAPVQIISPWAKHGVVDNHYYTALTMLRTVEQILGIHPMNQKDSAATPMRAAFTQAADYTPFNAAPNRTSLTLGLPTPPACGADTVAPQYAAAQPSTKVPAAEQQVAAQWQQWQKHQILTGANRVPDYANPAQMDHFTWYQTHGWTKPYPGETKIYAPDQVPGAYIPSSDSDG